MNSQELRDFLMKKTREWRKDVTRKHRPARIGWAIGIAVIYGLWRHHLADEVYVYLFRSVVVALVTYLVFSTLQELYLIKYSEEHKDRVRTYLIEELERVSTKIDNHDEMRHSAEKLAEWRDTKMAGEKYYWGLFKRDYVYRKERNFDRRLPRPGGNLASHYIEDVEVTGVGATCTPPPNGG